VNAEWRMVNDPDGNEEENGVVGQGSREEGHGVME
jgi:hypothetical protein